MAAFASFPGCGGGGASSGINPPPPPTVTVVVSPDSASVPLAATMNFTAAVSGTSNSQVTWSVNSIPGGSSASGTISADGLYTAPVDLPSPASVKITATSVAAPSSSASSQLNIVSNISIALSPGNASVELGAQKAFSATLSGAGQADTSINWSVAGPACPATCGTIDAAGLFTAPPVLPSPATVTVVARSVADPSKQSAANITITSSFTLQLSAPSSLPTSTKASLTATLTPVSGSNPSTVLNWSISGPGCTGVACGVLSPLTTQALSATNPSVAAVESANYTAPTSAPNPNTVVILAISQADPSKKASATISIRPGISIAISPSSATVVANHRVTLSVSVSGSSGSVAGAESSAVTWSVAGISGGNASVGQICVTNSSPCASVTSSSASQVDYLAPGAIPVPNPVTVTAASAADVSKSGAAQITVINHDVVTVLPGAATLAPGAIQKFTATVLGTTNQNVVWQLQGSACSAAGTCGSIAIDGTYTAPPVAPAPDAIKIIAISADDSSQSGFANVVISAGASIQSLHPASVYAGAANGFLLRVDGGGFVASGSGTGSALLIGGVARTTNCISAGECTAPVFSSDVAAPENLSVQIQNPDGSRSNLVSLVVAAPNVADESVALSSAAPAASGKDIVVVEPSTAGVSVPGNSVDLNIAALGVFSTASNTCTLAGNPIVISRPTTGTSITDICAFSQAGLDTSMSYTISGKGDLAVVAKLPAGLGIIHLTLQVPSTALPGARTLFIQNSNLDQTAASGVLEVQ